MKITLVNDEYGDWAGVYIDNKLAYENHSISLSQFIRTMQKHGDINITDMISVTAMGCWLEAMGSLPDNLDEVELLED